MEVPIKPLKVERKNGFFSDAVEPSLSQVRRLLKSAGITTNADLALLGGPVESLGMGDSLRGTIDNIKRFFSDTRVTATQTSRIEIAVTELHCPRATGVKAKLSVVRETEETGDCSVEIFGIGGSDEYTTTFSVEDALETSDGACIAAIYSVDAVFEACEIDTPDRQVRRFVRLKELVPNTGGVKGIQLTGTADACQTTDFGLINVNPEPFNLRQFPAASSIQQTLSLERGSKWKGGAKIKLEELGIEFGASYEGSRTHKTTLEYTLVGGFDYLAIKPRNQISWLWRVTP